MSTFIVAFIILMLVGTGMAIGVILAASPSKAAVADWAPLASSALVAARTCAKTKNHPLRKSRWIRQKSSVIAPDACRR